MGGGGSKNDQDQSQESLSFLDQSVKSVESGGSATVLSASNVRGNVDFALTQNGLNASDVGGILDKFITVGEGALDAVKQSYAATAEIAKSATATQTEVGSTINRLAMPVLVTLALIMLLPALIGRGK